MSIVKQLWVLTGGNGAGKSTFYDIYLKPTGLPLVNADILAKQLDADNTVSVSYQAAKLAEQLRHYLLHNGTSFCFETVFSHSSKIDFLAEAKAMGYEINLVYIHLQIDELNLARVAQRVAAGGHNVPEDKVKSRIPRTMRYVSDALPLVDSAKLYDNSMRDTPFKGVAMLMHGELKIHVDPLPQWAEGMLSVFIDE